MNVHPKVAAAVGGGTMGGAVSIVFVWALQSAFPHLVITDDVAQSFQIIFTGLVALASGWATNNPPNPPLPAQAPEKANP